MTAPWSEETHQWLADALDIRYGTCETWAGVLLGQLADRGLLLTPQIREVLEAAAEARQYEASGSRWDLDESTRVQRLIGARTRLTLAVDAYEAGQREGGDDRQV